MEDNLPDAGNVQLPRWFLWVVSSCSGFLILLFVPWASWVTTTLITINVKLDGLNDIQSRLTVLEQLDVERRVTTAVTAKRLDDMEKKIKDFEQHPYGAAPRGDNK